MSSSSFHSTTNRRAQVHALLSRHWSGLDGVCTSDEEDALVDRAGPARTTERNAPRGWHASTYGEVTERGARELAHLLGITVDAPVACRSDEGEGAEGNNKAENDEGEEELVFADLGSGVGKLTAQLYLEHGAVARTRGVELAPSRHRNAVAAWARARASGDVRRLRAAARRAAAPEAEAEAGGDGGGSDDGAVELVEVRQRLTRHVRSGRLDDSEGTVVEGRHPPLRACGRNARVRRVAVLRRHAARSALRAAWRAGRRAAPARARDAAAVPRGGVCSDGELSQKDWAPEPLR